MRKISFTKIFLFLVFSFFIMYFLVNIESFKMFSDNKNYIDFLFSRNTSDNSLITQVFKFDMREPKSIIEFDYPVKRSMFTFGVNKTIYVYNTHSHEEYLPVSEFNVNPTVMTASSMLADYISYPVVVESTKVMNEYKSLGYNNPYNYSRDILKEKLAVNSFDLIIDLHRDALSREASYIDIEGKRYAKILFVLGTANKNYKVNLALEEELNAILKKLYPGISRGIYRRDSLYNQDLSDKAILIEVGSQNSTLEEVSNSVHAISRTIEEYFNEQ